jgi:hypothetical protein
MTDFSARPEDRFQPTLDHEPGTLPWKVTVRFRAVVAFYFLLMAVITAIQMWAQTRPTQASDIVFVIVMLIVGPLLYAAIDFLRMLLIAVLDQFVLVKWFGARP